MRVTMISGAGATVRPPAPAPEPDFDDQLLAVRRQLLALSKRAGDLERLRAMLVLRDDVEGAIRGAVLNLRHDPDLPASWADIGEALGVTRQAALKRYGVVGGIRQAGGQPGNWR